MNHNSPSVTIVEKQAEQIIKKNDLSTILRPSDEVLIVCAVDPAIEELLPKNCTRLDEKASPHLLGIFDLILCQEAAPDVEYKKTTVATGSLLLQEGKKVLKSLSDAIPEITQIVYGDQDLETFCEEAGQLHPNHLSRFLSQLRQNGQISLMQQERMIEKYRLDKTEVEIQT
ncbi:MAG: hypothetical protein V4487_00180, partial [Chlamydiota bacterium]